MSETRDWSVIGYGGVGQEVARKIAEANAVIGLRHAPAFVMRSSGILEPDGKTPTGYESIDQMPSLPEFNFVATPPSADGEPTFSIIASLLRRGKKVITAEKSSLATRFGEMRDMSNSFRDLAATATVGGGERLMLKFEHDVPQKEAISQIHLNVSGTITATKGLMQQGLSLNEATGYCRTIGYAEPGGGSPYDTIRAEVIDAKMKFGIFFNTSGLIKELFDWRKLDSLPDNETIDYALSGDRLPMPYLLSLYRLPFHRNFEHPEETSIVDKSSHLHEDWKAVSGFRDTDKDPSLQSLAELGGPSNGYVVNYGPEGEHGTITETGPNGAGTSATAQTMINDYLLMVFSEGLKQRRGQNPG